MQPQIQTVITIIALIATCKGNFTHTKLNNTGIFFEKLDNIVFYKDKLEIITSINLPDSSNLIYTLLTCNIQLQELCKEILEFEESHSCKNFLKELRWEINEIERQDNKLKEMYGKTKRSIIDGVGKLSKFLFGTMDVEDAQNIYDNLDTLNDNQAKFIELGKNQIATIQSNFNTLSRPIIELQNETEALENKLNELITAVTEKEQVIFRYRHLKLQVAEISSLLLIKCLHLNKQQDEATEIITALENRKLHPMIISYANITTILQQKNMLFQANHKPINHEQVRQTIEVNYVEIPNQIVIKISVPLIEKEEYTLFKAYLVPLNNQTSTLAYVLDAEYIATNEDKSKFILLHAREIDECKVISTDLQNGYKLCKQQQLIITDKTNYCLPMLLENPFGIQNKCEYTHASKLNTIIKLAHSNAWLYSMHDTTKLIIKCENDTTTLEVTNEGVLTFQSSCKITAKDFTIEVEGKKETVEFEQPQNYPQLNDIEEIRINPEVTKILRTYTDRQIKPVKLVNHKDHNKEFMIENGKINDIRQTLSTLHNHTSKNNTSVYATGLILAVAIILTITIFTYLKCRKTKQNKKSTRNKHKTELIPTPTISAPLPIPIEIKSDTYGIKII